MVLCLICHLYFGGQVHCIGLEHEFPILLPNIESDEMQMLRIEALLLL